MADYTTNLVFRYTGTPPGNSLPFDQSFLINSGITFTDSDPLSTVFETTDTITVPFVFAGNYSYAGTAQYALQAGGFLTVPVLTNGSVTLVVMPQGIAANQVVIQSNFDASSLNTSDLTVCYAKGTQITGPDGETCVEDLRIGDVICTADGRTTRVLWVGRQTLLTGFTPKERQLVRIAKGALGGGRPYCDLTVTADHGMVFPARREAVGDHGDGLVINAAALVNGTTIDFVPEQDLEDSFTVYHIETKAHDVILANGAASETFVDAVTRSHFDNHLEYLELYGAERIIPEMPLPRIAAARLVPQDIKERLLDCPKKAPVAAA